jgi:predicted nucleic acid-binding Zn ribbon protein
MSTYAFSEALQRFLQESSIKDEMHALQIQDAWEALMGKTIARYTDQVRIQGKKLFIHTQVGPLRNELHFQRELIIEKVNNYIGTPLITELVLC